MDKIKIETNPGDERLNKLGILSWTYDSEETCYFLEGDVEVISDGGDAVRMGKGDLVTFPAGLSCTWIIHKAVKKHYQFK